VVIAERAISMDLVSDPLAPSKAREYLRGAMQTWRLDGIGSVVELLTDELVSNVVRHVGSPMHLRAQRQATAIRVEVDDESTEPPLCQHPAPSQDSGRGILLVDTLSTAWGFDLRAEGKTVWFEIDLEPVIGETDVDG
jgi:anti-sigma regulatory factor (Ser/Thr protein kinase)